MCLLCVEGLILKEIWLGGAVMCDFTFISRGGGGAYGLLGLVALVSFTHLWVTSSVLCAHYLSFITVDEMSRKLESF